MSGVQRPNACPSQCRQQQCNAGMQLQALKLRTAMNGAATTDGLASAHFGQRNCKGTHTRREQRRQRRPCNAEEHKHNARAASPYRSSQQLWRQRTRELNGAAPEAALQQHGKGNKAGRQSRAGQGKGKQGNAGCSAGVHKVCASSPGVHEFAIASP